MNRVDRVDFLRTPIRLNHRAPFPTSYELQAPFPTTRTKNCGCSHVRASEQSWHHLRTDSLSARCSEGYRVGYRGTQRTIVVLLENRGRICSPFRVIPGSRSHPTATLPTYIARRPYIEPPAWDGLATRLTKGNTPGQYLWPNDTSDGFLSDHPDRPIHPRDGHRRVGEHGIGHCSNHSRHSA